MNIGFDAKRAFHNSTGLGQYSRTLIRQLAAGYPEHHYYLFNPKKSKYYQLEGDNIYEILPTSFHHTLLRSAWRSSWVKEDLQRLDIDVYHGLSHEIPIGVNKTGIRTVVTIHDLLPERHPEHYNPIDVQIYRKKFLYACRQADTIIAISDQTKRDIIDFYNIPKEKITVCYQSCSPVFGALFDSAEKEKIVRKYNLPQRFFLSVGSIVERKNLLNTCKAFFLLRNDLDTPLVVIGNGGKYKQQVKDFILQHDLEDKIIFLSEKKNAGNAEGFLSTPDLAVIYQLAIAMIYPSFFEGFGVPVLEALQSRLPVITSNVSCLPEAGGPGSYYVDPHSASDIAEGIKKVYEDEAFAASMKEKGIEHAKQFAPDKCAASVMEVYKSLLARDYAR